jgi:hypothetical protein
MIARWKDPEARMRRTASIGRTRRSATSRARTGAITTALWQKPAYVKKHHESCVAAWEHDEERRCAASITSQDSWDSLDDDEYTDRCDRGRETFSKRYKSDKVFAERVRERGRKIHSRIKDKTAWRANVSASLQGRIGRRVGLTKETDPTGMLRRLSEAYIGRIFAPSVHGKWYVGKHGRIYMRSGWEVAFAKWCDRKGVDWSYEPKYFMVGKGIWLGITYTPDFFLPAGKLYIDVKGRFYEENRQKILTFMRLYPKVQFCVLRRKGLQELGVDVL